MIPFDSRLFKPIDSPPSIDIRAVTLSYVKKTENGWFSLNIDNLRFEAGNIHCIYGTNGCGKTSLLRFLSGMLPMGYSNVSWRNLSQPPIPGREHVFVTQAGPWPHWTVWRNICEPQQELGLSGAQVQAKTRLVVDLLGLQGLEDRYAHQLSAGQQQRTVLARALALSPKILLLDEIMSGQSEFWAERIAQILRKYVKIGGLIVVVSHDPEWVSYHADRVTHIISKHGDAVSSTEFFCGFDGGVKEWLKFREERLRPQPGLQE